MRLSRTLRDHGESRKSMTMEVIWNPGKGVKGVTTYYRAKGNILMKKQYKGSMQLGPKPKSANKGCKQEMETKSKGQAIAGRRFSNLILAQGKGNSEGNARELIMGKRSFSVMERRTD